MRIGQGTRLIGHICLMGAVTLGEFNTVGPFVAIGGEPQDLSYWGTPTRVEIGDHNAIGDRVTIHRASEKEDGVTRIGNNNRFLSGAHVAHDCKIGDRIAMGTGSLLGGHVRVGSDVTISDNVAIHQFVTVGDDSFIGSQSKITTDVPPYMRVEGNPSVVRGIDGQRLKLRGISGESLEALREAHRLIYVRKIPLEKAATLLVKRALVPEVAHLVKFLEAQHAGRVGRRPREPAVNRPDPRARSSGSGAFGHADHGHSW